ncbi:MAG: hypothetical protein IE931_00500 [Sphingobacteriales bacterium]|nr:hypothetical protein [Sphingobacteriales bacterium]
MKKLKLDCYFKKVAFFLIIGLFLTSCHPKSNNQLSDEIRVKISRDSSAILFSGIYPFILKELSADSLTDATWQHYFAIYPKVDEDVQELQKPLKGDYEIQKGDILFKPEQAFEKGKNYLIELYIQQPHSSILEELRSKVEPLQPKIIRKEVTF